MVHSSGAADMRLPTTVEIIDCTLRDGEQTAGVWFTLEEKIELAEHLSAAGVDVLDAGFPAASGSERESLQEMSRRKLRSRIGATARPLPGDVAAAAQSRAQEVFLFMPTSDLRLTETLGITRDRASLVFRAGAEDVVGRGMTLNLVLEDATRTAPGHLIHLVDDLRRHVPIARLVICDTVGCATPHAMERLIRTLDDGLDRQIPLSMHAHNDFGLASANTLAGVLGGARAITATVNGIGERAGNADLAECVAALTHLYGVQHGIDGRALPGLSRMVERMSGIQLSPTKPVTGFNVFRHESGVHVDAMLKDVRSYESLPAAWVGRKREYVLGKHSGTSLIRHLMDEAGIPCDAEMAQQLLDEVKLGAERRDKTEHVRELARSEAFSRARLAGLDLSMMIARRRLRVAG
ncbi:LeuA family protein [Sorangium sp. So ce887]|uniref:LeuA family protein n=1 Tax=Sorangium sp. So ce887 TaxID=3133324 RepID=UPI003F612AD9